MNRLPVKKTYKLYIGGAFPQASAGATFQASMRRGKFHGMIWAATPSGRGRRLGKAYSSLSAQPA